MEYDWDKNKAIANLPKHGVSFEEPKTVFKEALIKLIAFMVRQACMVFLAPS